MKKLIYTFVLLAACSGLRAQTLPSLLVDSDPVRLALAGSTVSSAAGAFSLDANAASMSGFDGKMAAGVSYGIWQPENAKDKILGAGALFKFSEKIAVGISAKMFSQPSYEVVDQSGAVSQVNGKYTPKENSFMAGASYKLAQYLSLGVACRVTSSKLAADAEANVFGADLSINYSREAFSAGISVDNIGGKVDYGGSAYDQPSMARTGAAYTFGQGESSAVTASVEGDCLLSGGFMAGTGVEYSFKKMIFVRGGFHYGDKEKAVPSYASLGLGVRYSGITFNVACILGSETLSNSLLAGVGFSF